MVCALCREENLELWKRKGGEEEPHMSSLHSWGYSGIPLCAAMEGQVWDLGYATAGVCLNVHGLHYYKRPSGCSWSGLTTGSMLMLKDVKLRRAGPAPHLLWCSGTQDSWPTPCLAVQLSWPWWVCVSGYQADPALFLFCHVCFLYPVRFHWRKLIFPL